MATVLVIDKDSLELELLAFLLQRDGHGVCTAMDAETALDIVQTRVVDLVTIETAGQRLDGVRLCQQIRQLNPYTPLMIVSERREEDQVVRGLVSAADDYVTKPVSPRIFLARVLALLRRANLSRAVANGDDSIVVGEVTLDRQHMSALVNGHRIRMTPRELSLLRTFMENANHVLSRDQLIGLAWGDGFVATPKAIDVYVLRLRQKMQPYLTGEPCIQAHRGFGYAFIAPALHVVASTAVPRRPLNIAEPATDGTSAS
jgi:DNA-binding response OmpR family regulator